MTRQKASPAALVRRQSRTLRKLAPGIASGDAEAVHQARVAIRRLRELLPLCSRVTPDAHRLRSKLAALTDALGRVRDLDVGLSVIHDVGRHSRRMHGRLATYRTGEERRRRHELHVLDKRTAAFRKIAAKRRTGPVRKAHDRHGWSRRLARRIERRRTEAIAAIEHARTPSRAHALHKARIAIKKLRYVTEAALELGLLRDTSVLRRLQRAQDLLGEIRDRQLVATHVKATLDKTRDESQTARTVSTMIDADVARLFRQFFRIRTALLASVRRVRTTPSRS